jgi:hypothetical protein
MASCARPGAVEPEVREPFPLAGDALAGFAAKGGFWAPAAGFLTALFLRSLPASMALIFSAALQTDSALHETDRALLGAVEFIPVRRVFLLNK